MNYKIQLKANENTHKHTHVYIYIICRMNRCEPLKYMKKKLMKKKRKYKSKTLKREKRTPRRCVCVRNLENGAHARAILVSY